MNKSCHSHEGVTHGTSLIVVKPLPGLISRSPTTMTNQLVTACGIWLIQSFLIYFLTGTLSKELTFLNYTDPGHVPCITRIWVQVETLLVFWTAEVHDHVSFGISHPGCVPTLPAQVSFRDGWNMNQPDPALFPFIPTLRVQVETLLVCFMAEVSDHISFDHFHLGCVATMPAYVVLWIGGGTLCPGLWRIWRAKGLSDATSIWLTHMCRVNQSKKDIKC